MGVGGKCTMTSRTIFGPNFAINTLSDLSFIIYRPEWEDSIKIIVTEKAYKDKD
jgi:hypothetical protein